MKDTIKEFRDSEFVEREYGEDGDFIDVISEGTTAEAIEDFWLSKLKKQNQDLLRGKKQLAKEMAEEMAEERVKAEIESYNKAKQDLLEEIREMEGTILLPSQVEELKNLIK